MKKQLTIFLIAALPLTIVFMWSSIKTINLIFAAQIDVKKRQITQSANHSLLPDSNVITEKIISNVSNRVDAFDNLKPSSFISTAYAKAYTENVNASSSSNNQSTVPPMPHATSSPILTYVSPNRNTCEGKYVLKSPLGNFGDPECNFSKNALYNLLKQLDPANADFWYKTVAHHESNYNPNDFTAHATSGSAWGLFQMGSGLNGKYDHGDRSWIVQVQNAVNYEKHLQSIGKPWFYWEGACVKWPEWYRIQRKVPKSVCVY